MGKISRLHDKFLPQRKNEEEAKQIKPGGAWYVLCFKYLQAKNIPCML